MTMPLLLALSALLLHACGQPEQNIVTAKDCIVPAGQEPPPECLDQAKKKENRGSSFLGVDNGSPDAKPLDAHALQSECTDWNAEWFHHFSSPELVRVCLQTGRAEINQTDGQGRTLLHRIASDLHKDDESFYDAAAEHWIDGVRSTEERRALVQHILSWEQYRPDLEQPDHAGETVLHTAVRRRRWTLVALLVNAGAEVDLPDATKDKITSRFIPLLQAFGQTMKNPAAGEVDFDALFGCQTADCLLGEMVKGKE